MRPAVIIEGDRAVTTVMEAMPVFDHDGGTMMMPVVRLDDHISLGCGCNSR